jgi:hypothetical protein
MDAQSAPKTFQRPETILELKIALSHADGSREMVRVQIERLLAVVGGMLEHFQLKKGDGPLIPGFRIPGTLRDQFGGLADHAGKLTGTVVTYQLVQPSLMFILSIPPPDIADRILGDQPDTHDPDRPMPGQKVDSARKCQQIPTTEWPLDELSGPRPWRVESRSKRDSVRNRTNETSGILVK